MQILRCVVDEVGQHVMDGLGGNDVIVVEDQGDMVGRAADIVGQRGQQRRHGGRVGALEEGRRDRPAGR